VPKRVIYGLGLFIIDILGLVAGGVIWAITLGTAALIAGNEFIEMTRAKGMKPSARIIRNMIIAFFVVAAIPTIPGIKMVNITPTWSVEHFPLLLTVGVCVSFIRLLFRGENPPATIADIAATILGFIYVGWLPSHLILLRNLVPPGTAPVENFLQQPGLAYVWASLFMIVATDVFAYYAGKLFGKNLLYPQVSPKKTVEGAIGGLLASIFWATVVVYCADHYVFPNSHPFQYKLWQAPLMGAVVSIGSQLGDLCESLLKRDAGVKDSGNLIPGHGGMLDRGDGLLFAGAISYYWVCLVVLQIL
jgi:phosphatidate cytidylyltransferase